MRNNHYICLLCLVFCLLASTSSLAQQDQLQDNNQGKYDLKYRTFRLALLPGLSTNGIDATQYVSKYSINIIGGYNGALANNGFEFGWLFNGNKYYAHGVQIAGLANYSGEETAGIQLAGLGTYSGSDLQGIQLSGIGNISAGEIQGIQFAGILNSAGDLSQGVQGAGILNTSQNGMQGLFGAGIGNLSGGEMQGILLSGVFNIANGEMQGIASSGVINYAETFQGISLSSININKEFQGIQIGQINIAEQGEGIQVGLLNYAKEFEGVPVGLLSYYQNGRTNIDIWASDGGFMNLGLKLGTNDIYNMISVGYNTLVGRDLWQAGWSIGKFNEYQNHFMYSDFSYFKINEGDWTKKLNSNFKYRLLLGKQFSGSIKFYGGPTLNMLVSRVDNRNEYTRYRLFDFGTKEREYIFWVGLSAGIELF